MKKVEIEQVEKIKEPITKEDKLSLVMVGDNLIHSAVYAACRVSPNVYDFTQAFSAVRPIIKNYDLSFINQESIIGGKDLGLSSYPQFNSPDELGDAVIDTGFNIINLANNHTLDKSEKGILYSTAYWKNKGIYAVGSYQSFEDRNSPVIKEKNGITYSVLSYTTLTNGFKVPSGKEYLVNLYDENQVKQDIENIRSKVDILIVSMHWGTEYTNTPTQSEIDEANYLSSLGVDIIIGHHPHVVQPITKIGKTVVIYSLGNFLSGQEDDKRIGLMASLDITKKTTGPNVDISINNIKGSLIYTYHDSHFKNYKVIPFTQLSNDLLPNYETIKNNYNSIIRNYDQTILVD